MTIEESIILAVAVSAASVVAPMVVYHFLKKIARATKEYNEASGVVKHIVLTFNQRQQEQDKKIDETAYKLEGAESRSERLAEQINAHSGRLNYVTSNLKDVWTGLKRVAGHLENISGRVSAVEKTQIEMQRQISDLNLKYTGILPEGEIRTPPTTEIAGTFESLTETEREVLRILASQGPKSATELSKLTKKTREHTARTMKKLFQLGYVNRETHRLPYRYTLNDKAHKVIQETEKQEPQTHAKA